MAYFILVVMVVFIDQWTKVWAKANLTPGRTYPVVKGWLAVCYMENKGAAYNFLQGRRKILMAIVSLSMAYMTYLFFMNLGQNNVFMDTGFLLILGGALGNYMDRIRLGYVVDFLYVKIKGGPVFNFADIFVVSGTLILMYFIAFTDLLIH